MLSRSLESEKNGFWTSAQKEEKNKKIFLTDGTALERTWTHYDFKKLKEDLHGCNVGWQRWPRAWRLVHLFKMFGLHPKGQCSQEGLLARVSSQSWVFQDDLSCGVEALEEGEQTWGSQLSFQVSLN